MKKRQRKHLVIALIAVLVIISVSAAIFFINSERLENFVMPPNTVIEVIDGDTFNLYEGADGIGTVRLLCVNTPEKNQTGYEEAKDYLKSLILNKQVILNSSVTDSDIYSRMLRYVYVNDSDGNLLFVNKLILDNNYGSLMVIPPEECNEVK